MPYRTVSELPQSVKILPIEAQRMFLKVFNSSWDRYHDEEKCFKIAWGAVKRVYRKTDDRWVRKTASFDFKYSADLWPEKHDGKHYARIYLIDTTVNRAKPRWQVTDEALERALGSVIDLPLIAYPDHSGKSAEIGFFEKVEKKDGYAVGLAEITDGDAWEKIRNREWRSVSPSVTAFDVTRSDGVKIIDDFAFDHVAFVPRPAYSRARVLETFEGQECDLRPFSVALTQKLQEVQRENKMSEYAAGVIPFEESRKAPEDTAWDFRQTEYDVDQLKRACAWFDSENPDVKGSYKLPHHLPDGRVVWRGVAAAMQVLLGARGGVDIPAGDRRGCYLHLKKHYSQFEREPPEYHGQETDKKPRSAGSEKEGKNMSEEELQRYKADLEEATKKIADLEAENERLTTELEDLKKTGKPDEKEAVERIADLEKQNEQLKADLDAITEERHLERVGEFVDLRVEAGLTSKDDRDAAIEEYKKFSADILDTMAGDLRAFIAQRAKFVPSGPKAKYTAEQRLDAVEKMRKQLYGYTRDEDGKIVGEV